MRDYWILWTYCANYSDAPQKVRAETAYDAVLLATSHFSADFASKAVVYVFDTAPVLTVKPVGAVRNA